MESFGFQLGETALTMRRDFDRRAANLGVTRAQWRVLLREIFESAFASGRRASGVTRGGWYRLAPADQD